LVAALVAGAAAVVTPANAQDGPLLRADGPNAELFGLGRGYPTCAALAYNDDRGCRVGAFSNFGALSPSRVIRAPAQASALQRAPKEPSIRYEYEGKTLTLDDYLNSRPVTGLLIARDDTILVERYQYGRTDKHLLTSFSMAKSIIGLLVGLAIDRGAIRSIDDTADAYVPALEGTEFGRTPIRALLQMASGVAFSENYNDRSSDIFTLARLTLGQDPAGSLQAVKRFNTRRHPPGQAFWYSSADSLVLASSLRARPGGRSRSSRVHGCGSRWARRPTRLEPRRDRPGDHLCLLQCRAAGLGTARPDAGAQGHVVGQRHRAREMAGGRNDAAARGALASLRLSDLALGRRRRPVLPVGAARAVRHG
jgi:hypothetical protein